MDCTCRLTKIIKAWAGMGVLPVDTCMDLLCYQSNLSLSLFCTLLSLSVIPLK